MNFLNKARALEKPRERPDWVARADFMDDCWPEIVALVEAAEATRPYNEPVNELLIERLDALDKKADEVRK